MLVYSIAICLKTDNKKWKLKNISETLLNSKRTWDTQLCFIRYKQDPASSRAEVSKQRWQSMQWSGQQESNPLQIWTNLNFKSIKKSQEIIIFSGLELEPSKFRLQAHKLKRAWKPTITSGPMCSPKSRSYSQVVKSQIAKPPVPVPSSSKKRGLETSSSWLDLRLKLWVEVMTGAICPDMFPILWSSIETPIMFEHSVCSSISRR